MLPTKKNEIVLIGIILEGILIIIYFAWAYLTKSEILSYPTALEIFSGFLASIPIFFVNFIFFFLLVKHFPQLLEFKKQIVEPLADELDLPSIFIISLFAGFAEELFFRGLLQVETGIVFSSICFSVLHFGSMLRKFFLVALIYFFISLYLGFLYQHFNSLWPAISAHFLYDLLVLLYLRYLNKRAI